MFCEIFHRTAYSYSRPVSLEPHVLRVRPRSDGTQHVRRYSLRVFPEPVQISHGIDLEGNAACQVIFQGQTERLEVTVEFEVETLRTNPFDFIITDAGALAVPLRYREGIIDALAHYRVRPNQTDAVDRFAKTIAGEAGFQTLPFLSRLTERIWQLTEKEIRLEGAPYAPEFTLNERRGSCRDLSVLFIDACRSVGLASRFVSGYWEGDPEGTERHLHAWAEVYLPGGGWRAFDPSKGLAISDRHVAIAAAAIPDGAAPVTGTFRGINATAALDGELEINFRGVSTSTV